MFNDFSNLTLKQIFQKTTSFFKIPGESFLSESTKIEKATFPYKSALSEANVKTNRMGSAKWSYDKEQSFDSNYTLFYKQRIFLTQPQC